MLKSKLGISDSHVIDLLQQVVKYDIYQQMVLRCNNTKDLAKYISQLQMTRCDFKKITMIRGACPSKVQSDVIAPRSTVDKDDNVNMKQKQSPS